MTPTILASGSDRRLSLGMAAVVATEAAALTGAGTLMVAVGEGARRRGPTLVATTGARRIERALRESGLRASARGHLCYVTSLSGARDGSGVRWDWASCCPFSWPSCNPPRVLLTRTI